METFHSKLCTCVIIMPIIISDIAIFNVSIQVYIITLLPVNLDNFFLLALEWGHREYNVTIQLELH